MPRVVRDWEVDERGEYFCYVDTYTAQLEADGELTAAQANIIMLTPYLRNLYRRWRGTGWIPVEYPVRR